MTEGARSWAVYVLAAVLAGGAMSPARSDAQIIDERWSPPRRLSFEQRRTATATMVPDPFGHLHALWIESQNDGQTGSVGYARFDGTTWSDPIRIAAMKYADSNHRSVAGVVDRSGLLHVVWNSGITGPMHYASVAVRDSTSASSWSWSRPLDFAAYRIDLQVDSKGALHLLFSRFYDARRGVYYARSTDGGDGWTAPVQLDPDIPQGYAPYYISLRTDDAGGVHALWHYYAPDTARGKSIHYARSIDGGDSWSAPMTMAALDASGENLWKANPTLAVSGAQIHVVWAGGAPNSTFRVHRFSGDRGEHWSAPERIFGDLLGEANGDGMAVDALGRIHWVGQVRYPQALYHAFWDRDRWSSPVPFYLIAQGPHEPIGDRIHAHNVRLGIRAGNQLSVSFTGIVAPTVLYATQRTLEGVPERRDPVPPPPARRISREMWGLVALVVVAATSALRQLGRRRHEATRG